MPANSEEFEIQKRRGLVVWVYSLRQLKNLRRFGFIHYVSRRMKYVFIYVNEEKVDECIEKLTRLHFVRHVDVSHRPDIEMNFGEKIGTKAAFQVVEDKGDLEERNATIRLAEHV
ncbi:YlbG family protein [Enterococcus olivae]